MRRLTAVGAALVATAALVAAGCSKSTRDDCELRAYALAVAPAGKGGGGRSGGGSKSGVSKEKPGPGKHAPGGKKAKTRHSDTDCDDW